MLQSALDPPYAVPAPMSVHELRSLDRRAVEGWGAPSLLLMENAGRGAAAVIHRILGETGGGRVVILCGGGNNGGDGFVAARHLAAAGCVVEVAVLAARERIQNDARINLQIVEHLGLPLLWIQDSTLPAEAESFLAGGQVIVDALLGTGATGAPGGAMAVWIRAANAAHVARRVAIDVPSGLSADDGFAQDPCFRADMTVTMAAPKLGFARAVEWVGQVVVADIGVPAGSPGISSRRA